MAVGTQGYNRSLLNALLALPALAILIIVGNEFWDFPHQDLIVAILMAIELLFATRLRRSSLVAQAHGAGEVDGYVSSEGVDELSGNPDLKFVFTKHPSDLLEQDVIRFEVKRSR